MVVGPTVVAVTVVATGVVTAGLLAVSLEGVPSAWAINPMPANVAVTLRPVAATFEATAVRGRRRRAIIFRPAAR